MIAALLAVVFNALVVLTLVGGLFFLFAGALGVARLPDFYSRSHASSKCVTLGVAGMLLALVLYIGVGTQAPGDAEQRKLDRETAAEVGGGDEPVIAAATKAVLVIAFVFVSAPVGAHMLARAAHLAGATSWHGTLSDDLAEDRARDFRPPKPPFTPPVA